MTDASPSTDAVVGSAAAPVRGSAPVPLWASRRRVPAVVAVAVAWLALTALAALLADVLPLTNPDVDAGAGVATAPFHVAAEPLGTDAFGRSVLARLVYGARVSLLVGLTAVAIALAFGLVVGVTAGYLRGKVDLAIGILTDAALAFPGLVLLLGLTAVLQPGVGTLILGLSVFATPSFIRLARANTLQLASSEFVMAARGLGARTGTVLFRELLPNVALTLLPYAGVVAAGLILAESALSFLGLGVPLPQASWGNMIAEGRTRMRATPELVFVPVLALFLTIYSLNIVGEWFRRGDVSGG